MGAGPDDPQRNGPGAALLVSQGTVRKAVEALAAENLLARRQGKGTYVSSHQEAKAQFRFLRLRPDDGPATQPESRILDCRRLRAPADVAAALSIRAGESVLFIRRLLTFEDEPVVLDDIWLAGEEFRQLTGERLANHSGQLYAVIETELGTTMIHAREKLRAVCATADQAAATRDRRRPPAAAGRAGDVDFQRASGGAAPRPLPHRPPPLCQRAVRRRAARIRAVPRAAAGARVVAPSKMRNNTWLTQCAAAVPRMVSVGGFACARKAGHDLRKRESGNRIHG